jgi:hypothetical protein
VPLGGLRWASLAMLDTLFVWVPYKQSPICQDDDRLKNGALVRDAVTKREAVVLDAHYDAIGNSVALRLLWTFNAEELKEMIAVHGRQHANDLMVQWVEVGTPGAPELEIQTIEVVEL